MTTIPEEDIVEAAQRLLKGTLEIVDIHGGYCGYTLAAEMCARALIPPPSEDSAQLSFDFSKLPLAKSS